ncbi:hypothetical protein A2U01_0031688, partial [Trifolium medium]|nr:hypothetical protein [Trifolium medium]
MPFFLMGTSRRWLYQQSETREVEGSDSQVNLSRFHRPEGNISSEDRNVERKGKHVNSHYVHNKPRNSSTNGRQQSHHSRVNIKDSYAQAKAFIGVVVHTGMTYNIQNAFHEQGYFGVKATPLGSNLILLEGQEVGEMEALMEDAKDWLDQWFKE